jgi:Kef-type K+ transport system membrane component KefB
MDIFLELGLVLAIATFVAIVMRMIKQPLIVGYILTGIILGPYALNLLKSTDHLELFSKIGISVLLFIVGLSLSPKTIEETGKVSLITGIGQVVFTSVIGFFLLKLLGYGILPSLYGAIALTFSSTIIILKLLSDKGDLGKLYGKISIGFLLVQDLVATLLIVAIPIVGAMLLGTQTAGAGIGLLLLFAKGLVTVIIVLLIAKYLLPKLSRYLAKSQELLFLFSITWGLVLAGLFHTIGFSIEIGALIAGFTFSVSTYSYEMSSRLRPLRDFFIVLFFILLGAQIALGNIGILIVPAVILSVFVLVGNPLIVFILMNAMGYRNRTSFMAGLTVAQISEFSLILMALGLSLGHIDEKILTLITLVGIITITGSTYMMLYADKLYDFLSPLLKKIAFRKSNKETGSVLDKDPEVIIFGYGRVGEEFTLSVQSLGKRYLMIDYDPEIIKKAQLQNISCMFGDAEDIEFLQEINFAQTPMIVSTIPEAEANVMLVRLYRRTNKEGIIIVVAHSISQAEALYREGASYVVLPHSLGAYHASRMLYKFQDDRLIFEQARKLQAEQIARYK